MCIFFNASGQLVIGGAPQAPREVRVAGTRIFARLTAPRSQLLIYEMSFGAAQDTAMVLPLPVAAPRREGAVRFIDLSDHPWYFDRLAEICPIEPEVYEGFAIDGPAPAALEAPRPRLAVHEVGAYEASYVPSIEDFDRLDARFEIPADLWSAFPQYAQYGFAVFRLGRTESALKRVHPMALEFATSLDRQLFYPTVHIHDGKLHDRAHFDHQIYVQGAWRARQERLARMPAYPGEFRHGTATYVGPHWIEHEAWKWIKDLSAEGWTACLAAKRAPGDPWAPSPAQKRRGEELLATAPSPARWFLPVAECWPYLDPFEPLSVAEVAGELANKDTLISVDLQGFRPLPNAAPA